MEVVNIGLEVYLRKGVCWYVAVHGRSTRGRDSGRDSERDM